MALSFVSLNATGASGDFAIPFDYFSPEHIEARVNNIIVGFTLLNPALLRITPTPAAGTIVTIRRVTPPDLVVAPKDLPLLVRRLGEESRDVFYSFDALYGDIFYDIVFSVTDGTASNDIVGAINPNLNLSLSDTSTVCVDVAPPDGSINFTVEAISSTGVITPLATAAIPANTTRGIVNRLSSGPIPSGQIIRVRQGAGSATYNLATLLLRFTRN